MKVNLFGLLLSGLLLLAACSKDSESVDTSPKVMTGSSTEIYRKGAVLSGSIQQNGMGVVKNYGILLSDVSSMTRYTEYPAINQGANFSVSVRGLNPNTTYYYCTYVYNGSKMIKGEVKSFTTLKTNVPIFDAVSLLEKDEFCCKLSVSFIDEGGSDISTSGFCWSKKEEGEPTTDSSLQSVQIEDGCMSAIIEGLEPNSEYLFRAYAVNADGLAYSETMSVKTNEAVAPVLSAITEKEATDFSVIVEAEIIESGSLDVDKVGFCWSDTNAKPTIEDSVYDRTEQLNDGNKIFDALLSDLKPYTTYYIRAYATNALGTSYSEVFTFVTAKDKAPTLSAITKTSSSYFSVSIQAKVTDEGTASVTETGFCWSVTNEFPTTDDNKKELEGLEFETTLSELQPGTTYYIRAYAISEVGTSYSEVLTFTTADAQIPTLSTITKTSSSYFSVSIQANILDVGTSEVTQSGFCWSTTNQEPTVNDTKKELEGLVLETTLSELKANTTYYIRAYAINGQGISYSEVFVFKTAEPKKPTLSAIAQIASSYFSVTVEAQVTDSGTSEVTKVGFCWSTYTSVPTISSNVKELEGSVLTMTLDELSPSTTYYIRAYATNDTGTAYSEVFTFTTADPKVPTLSSITQTASEEFSVSIKAEITDVGTSEVTQSGFCWDKYSSPTVNDKKKEVQGPVMETILSELEPNTTYYIRAYAINRHGTAYSEEFKFKTAPRDASPDEIGIGALDKIEW